MLDGHAIWQTVSGLLLAAVPLCYAVGAAMPVDPTRPGGDPRWRGAELAAGAAFAIALALAAGLAAAGGGVHRGPTLLPLGPLGALEASTRLDTLTAVMLALVSFVGLAVVRYSRGYLDGDPGQGRYRRWLLATLAAVAVLVTTNNLLLIALAWLGTSLALHQLLTFYPDRPQALVAAHKKFLASRVAELCLLGGIALIGLGAGSLELDALGPAAASPLLGAATLLIAAACALKCAQLPFHGWLIQVMEAPTPVSALLHAGIVNIGGFLLIRLAPLMTQSEPAQTLLVAIGTVTAVVAAAVATTRVSAKVALAWSTCAQMGFMLLQCGLGAYALALLHLVGHSLYKAHAFLGAGSAVDQWRVRSLAPAAPTPGLGAWLAAAVLAAGGVAVAGAALGANPLREPALWALATVVSLALGPLVVRGFGGGWRTNATAAGAGLGIALLYFGAHAVFTRLLPVPALAADPAWSRIAIVVAGFGLLYALHAATTARPDGALARALHPWLYAGLHLDELFTRLTFRVWPAKLAAPTPPAALHFDRQEA